jgi:hypothetical protein
MKNPQAHEFLRAWREVTAIRRDDLLANWSANLTKYTSIIQKDKGCVIDEVAQKLNLKSYNEYYSTDAFLYSEEDLVSDVNPGQKWFRGIKVAFEHEHIYNKRLYEEISHLLILHSELSVLVTYPPPGDFRHLEHLDYFHSIIQGSPRAEELDENENFLLIFGYRDPLEWKGLVYKNDWWEEIAAP